MHGSISEKKKCFIFPTFQSNKCQERLRVEEVVSSTYPKLRYVGNVRPPSLMDVWVRFSVEFRVIFTRCYIL